jgi:dipeptidyl aminopeptidase/acylaminoacyl peptidase
MVLLVHGGPWARDLYGFDPNHQWLADRGLAVLSVNFRGSTGFGKAFVNAGDLEWGRKMHDDLIDAVDWAVKQGIAERDRVAIMGGSYGGYATLAALAFTPQVFRCGVDIVGPSNLETLLATIPPYWAAFYENLTRRVGDPRTEAGHKLLQERSPLNSASAITRPLLIAQGANDPRVKQAESDQIITAMRAKGLPVTYVLYPEEGHGLAIPENRISFFAITEAFLAAHLDSRAEPIGEDFKGAKLEVREGAAQVPGLEAALAKRETATG